MNWSKQRTFAMKLYDTEIKNYLPKIAEYLVLCECVNWARAVNLKYLTNHHPNCPHYNDSLIDVWKMTVNGSTCYFVEQQDVINAAQEEFEDETTITKEKMHREVFEHLPECEGF